MIIQHIPDYSPDPQGALVLDRAKELRWEAVKRLRDAAVNAGTDVQDIGRFDSDLLSRTNINGAVTVAMLAKGSESPFSIEWRLADNSVVTLDGDQMIFTGLAMAAHVQACYDRAKEIESLILATTCRPDLDLIDITTGWPT